jgi:hypothetical protein
MTIKDQLHVLSNVLPDELREMLNSSSIGELRKASQESADSSISKQHAQDVLALIPAHDLPKETDDVRSYECTDASQYQSLMMCNHRQGVIRTRSCDCVLVQYTPWQLIAEVRAEHCNQPSLVPT